MRLSLAARAWYESGTHVTVEGKRIYVREVGDAAAPALLLVHGFPSSSYDWRHVMRLLADAFHCVALDLPGYGLSDKPVAYSYSLFQQADVVEGVVHHCGLHTAHVLSHDVGTSVHTELLARQAEGALGFEVLTSTLLNGSILKKMATLTEFQRILENPSQAEQAQALCDAMLPGYASGLRRLMSRPDALSDEDAEVMTELLAYHDGHRRVPQVYGYVRERYLLAERWLDALQRAEGPVQLLWGADDPVANVTMGRALAELLPRARYQEVAGVGHFMPFEAPEVIAAAMRSFVDSASPVHEGSDERSGL